MANAIANEIDQNFDYFQRHLGEYLNNKKGTYALIRHCNVVGFYDSAFAAEKDASRLYEDDIFSIQEVTSSPVDLGFFTHAVNSR